jgi:hypothetical protein
MLFERRLKKLKRVVWTETCDLSVKPESDGRTSPAACPLLRFSDVPSILEIAGTLTRSARGPDPARTTVGIRGGP